MEREKRTSRSGEIRTKGQGKRQLMSHPTDTHTHTHTHMHTHMHTYMHTYMRRSSLLIQLIHYFSRLQCLQQCFIQDWGSRLFWLHGSNRSAGIPYEELERRGIYVHACVVGASNSV